MSLLFLLRLNGIHSEKMNLFQSFDDKIAAHKGVLKSRAEMLDEARAGLIANGKALA